MQVVRAALVALALAGCQRTDPAERRATPTPAPTPPPAPPPDADDRQLSSPQPLRVRLGTGDRLAFEGSRPLTDITRAELASRYAPVFEPGTETALRLGPDEIGPVTVTLTLGPDQRVDQLALTFGMPPDQLPTRGRAVLERFGKAALDPTPTWTAFGARDVTVTSAGARWMVTVRRRP